MGISIKQLEKIKKTIEAEYKIALANLNEDRNKKLEAVDLIANLAKTDKSSNAEKKLPVGKKTIKRRSKKSKPSASQKKQSVSGLIREVIENITIDFDKNTIVKIAKEKNPDIKLTKDSVRIVTSGMEKEGKLVKVFLGKGKRPTVYSKKKAPTENEQPDSIE